jgi:hypothetical protein
MNELPSPAPAEAGTLLPEMPNRCVIVVDRELAGGRLANAIAVIALTVGQRHPGLVGEPLVDAAGFAHPGLIPIGVTLLAAGQEELPAIRDRALAMGCDIIDFPVEGQETKDYQAFRAAVAGIPPADMRYTGVVLIGQKKTVSKIVGRLELLN